MIWDDNNIKLLQKLWDKGLSTTEIAKKMNISKNSVVGKVHRLCLKARPSPIKKKDDELVEELNENIKNVPEDVEIMKENSLEEVSHNDDLNNEGASETEVKAKNESVTPKKNSKGKNSKNIKLVELDSHTCRWPIGDPRDEDFCFCGKKVRTGQTYCDEHSQIAYVKALPKK